MKSIVAWLRIPCWLLSVGLASCQPYKVQSQAEWVPADDDRNAVVPARKPAPAPGLDYSLLGQALVLPAQQQRSVWQTWAADASNEALQEQAIVNLSQKADATSLGIFFQGLVNGKSRLRLLSSRALMEIGPGLSAPAKDALMMMLAREPDESAGALAWASVLAEDPRVYERAIDLYRKRAFSRVQYFDGRVALDAALLGALNLPRTLSLSRDADPEVRSLVAATCSRVAQPECAPWLVEFARDVYPEVRTHAIPGLAKLGTKDTLDALTLALRGANEDWRKRYLEALRDDAGLHGLVAALQCYNDGTAAAPEHIQQVFELIDSHAATPRRSMLDARGADAMADYMERAPSANWRFRAATVLAIMGDLRAVPVLAERIGNKPPPTKGALALQDSSGEQDDEERATAARLIADLSDLHTESQADIRKWSESAILGWLQQRSGVRPDAMRALVKMDSKRGIEWLYKWSNAPAKLPAIHDRPPLGEQWLIAQAALRYLGRVHGDTALRRLEDSLQRRPSGLDASAAASSRGNYQVLASALNSLGIGAAQGLSEAGNEQATDRLYRFAMDRSEHEQSRLEACRAMAFTATTAESRRRFLARARGLGTSTGSARFDLTCLLETLASRANPELQDDLVAFLYELVGAADTPSAFTIARSLGRFDISESAEPALVALLQRGDAASGPAALALLLGGRSELAILAALRMLGQSPQAQTELQQAYYHSFDFLSDEDLERDAIFRWVRNARAVEQFSPKGVRLKWPWDLLGQQLRNLEYDKGPHSLTRTVFRNRLYQQALAGNRRAIDTLLLAGERGMLFALRDTPGPLTFAAYRAYFRFLPHWQNLGVSNPKLAPPSAFQTSQ